MAYFRLLSRSILVLTMLMSGSALAGEKDELATTLRQLDQVQASLERARVLAVQEGQTDRFYFDYLRANRDLNIVREGINRYLTPSRAQPGISAAALDVTGQYRQERIR
ncbi:integrative conjugative element protein, RAQPRD family [Photorhabdus luminescens]|uniref:Integrative conjugative element protein, RAQPRD family n=1 Tax=Photorhabdus akhurstii TaxID=171438 RepID=A0ABX8LZT6_9GAMM|nr:MULTISPECIES: RAQPRD family integrative conjugative element protein [Photorhabdus]NRN30489.1 integrative conjugative element protein, RAQPRD family [Photorhabdus heterorhabditis subsp. aluminescens]QXF35435.1 integrative conjugative element protein, RAQPRD family [Photorhabdus akhurstii]UJD77267.1 integrative conjugative element protein, RAQPRD family [Photorhabdus luminescens]